MPVAPERLDLGTMAVRTARTYTILRQIKSGDKKAATKTVAHKQAIISYLTENVSAKSTDIAELLVLKPTRAKEILAEMVDEQIVVAEGGNKNRVYKLKA